MAAPAHPVQLAPDEINRYAREGSVSQSAAHRFLTLLRDRHRHTQNIVFLHDLTDSQEFNWKAWVSQRPDVDSIVGPGIYRFAFVWVSSTDTNLKERRGDFLVSRIDGVDDIRLHPQRNKHITTGMKEALPVRGSWAEQWSPESPAAVVHGALSDALAASQGQATPAQWLRRPEAYDGISEADTIGKHEALRFLKQEEDTWYAQPHPRRPFRADITCGTSAVSQGQFDWPYFVHRRQWFQDHFMGFSITTFEVAWNNRNQCAVFIGRRNDDRPFTVNPRARNQAKELSWDLKDIAEI